MTAKQLQKYIKQFVDAQVRDLPTRSSRPEILRGTCVTLSKALLKELELTKTRARLVYGYFYYPNPSLNSKKSFFYNVYRTKSGQDLPVNRWCPHCWLETDKLIIDPTIEQFLQTTRKYVRALNDPRYKV
jgi:hypothetical protein